MGTNDDKRLNEYERTYEGCYGLQVKADRLVDFLTTNFRFNDIEEEAGNPRIAQCVWGHPGTGKTSIIKQLRETPVEWRGKQYPGWDVHDVPIAQFEEMGDLHGIPMDSLMMRRRRDGDSESEEQWVPQNEMTIAAFRDDGWEVDTSIQPRTIMAPPDWVPLKPGPAILLLDDWNRASIRIIKGIMQLLQNYGMVSWSLPAGCNIVLTGNPDEQNYLVTTIDKAILTRIEHVTLVEDAKLWAEWAAKQKLDHRGISWVLYQPEMMHGKERTNLRTLSHFFRKLTAIGNLQNEDARKQAMLHAHSLLDEETVTAFIVFCTRKMEDIVEPEDILDGRTDVAARLCELMSSDKHEPRSDILGVMIERLFGTMVDPSTKQTPERIENFQRFITNQHIPEDCRHALCNRLSRRADADGRNQKWLLNNSALRGLILEMFD